MTASFLRKDDGLVDGLVDRVVRLHVGDRLGAGIGFMSGGAGCSGGGLSWTGGGSFFGGVGLSGSGVGFGSSLPGVAAAGGMMGSAGGAVIVTGGAAAATVVGAAGRGQKTTARTTAVARPDENDDQPSRRQENKPQALGILAGGGLRLCAGGRTAGGAGRVGAARSANAFVGAGAAGTVTETGVGWPGMRKRAPSRRRFSGSDRWRRRSTSRRIWGNFA